MKNVCLDLREHSTRRINYGMKEMISLTKEEKKMHRRQKNVIYARKDLALMITIKKIIAIILENREVLLMISAI